MYSKAEELKDTKTVAIANSDRNTSTSANVSSRMAVSPLRASHVSSIQVAQRQEGLNAGEVSSLLSELKSEFQTNKKELTVIDTLQNEKPDMPLQMVVQRLLSDKEARKLLTKLLQVSRDWKRTHQKIGRLLESIGKPTTSTESLSDHARQLEEVNQGNEPLLQILAEIRQLLTEMDTLANDIHRLANDIRRATKPPRNDSDDSGSGSDEEDSSTLAGMVESIYMNMVQE